MSKKEENFLKKKNLNENDLKNVSGGQEYYNVSGDQKCYVDGVRWTFDSIEAAMDCAIERGLDMGAIHQGSCPGLDDDSHLEAGNQR